MIKRRKAKYVKCFFTVRKFRRRILQPQFTALGLSRWGRGGQGILEYASRRITSPRRDGQRLPPDVTTMSRTIDKMEERGCLTACAVRTAPPLFSTGLTLKGRAKAGVHGMFCLAGRMYLERL